MSRRALALVLVCVVGSFVPAAGCAGSRPAGDVLLDGWIFANGAAVDCVWVDGRKQVEGGRHVAREAVGRRFTATMRALAEG